ncbi:hypothetical protein TcCL_Unassigned01400 [Trypanosoma cruzi]|nr:hypothetical protein TcCL_Unassigned01400 [Trypanosoma cruzi]
MLTFCQAPVLCEEGGREPALRLFDVFRALWWLACGLLDLFNKTGEKKTIGVDRFSLCPTAAFLLFLHLHAVCTASTWTLLVVQCRPIGHASGANGHMLLCWDPATPHGGCVGLRGRWGVDGVTVLIVFSRLCVGGRAVAGCLCVPLCLFAVVPVFLLF